MKTPNKTTLSLLAAFLTAATVAWAGGNELAYFKVQELPALTGTSAAAGDLMPLYDVSAGKVKSVDLGANLAVLAGLSGLSAAELDYVDIATLGTLEASKSWTSDASLDTVMPTGGLLTVQSGGAITLNSGATLTVAGTLATTGSVTATGSVVSTRATTADSGTTNKAVSIALTAPVDTTGTNSHVGYDFAPTIGNATGGTNSVIGYNFANVTGDAQVNVTALSIGTGTTLGTSNAISVGSGWDAGLEVASPVSITSTIIGDGGDALYGFKESQVASTTTSVTLAQCGTHFISNSADVMTLPEASTVLGCRYTFTCGTADDFDINPADGTDAISSVSTTNGTTAVVTLAPSAGDAIRCTDIGGSITLEAIGADLWAQVAGGNGVWTDVN